MRGVIKNLRPFFIHYNVGDENVEIANTDYSPLKKYYNKEKKRIMVFESTKILRKAFLGYRLEYRLCSAMGQYYHKLAV